MLRLATADEPAWRVCTLEIDRGRMSYTIDTLRQLHEELPEASLFFCIGSDAIRDVTHWKEPEALFQRATPLVVHRAGEPQPDLSALGRLCPADAQPVLVEMPAMDISSTEIRRSVAAVEPIEHLVPPTVAKYIAEHGLYR
jgi:nicotinate-nucleotide adenylyltransferase